jgi:hypothetical protein
VCLKALQYIVATEDTYIVVPEDTYIVVPEDTYIVVPEDTYIVVPEDTRLGTDGRAYSTHFSFFAHFFLVHI